MHRIIIIIAIQHIISDMELLRIGFVGLGYRGMATIERYGIIPQTLITAVCDIDPANVDRAIALIHASDSQPVARYVGTEAWMQLCESDEVDLVYFCTPWKEHARMAIYAMQRGKHVAVEIPICQTIQEGEEIIEVARNTGRYCFMLENCCYDTFHLGVMEMVRNGILGELTHLEGAYIHDIRDHSNIADYCPESGNPYPTHGLGPVCQLLNLQGDNPLMELTSVTSRHHISQSILLSKQGQTITLSLDVTTPRPYSRAQITCGTKGFVQKYPIAIVQIEGQEPIYGDEATAYVESHIPAHYKRLIDEGKKAGAKNIMNYVMDRRLVSCLIHHGTQDISVQDAVEWSYVVELSKAGAHSEFVHRTFPSK